VYWLLSAAKGVINPTIVSLKFIFRTLENELKIIQPKRNSKFIEHIKKAAQFRTAFE